MTDLPVNQILCGDATELMRGLPSNSIHAIVTDPPYGLEFMGEEWDKFREEGKSKYFHRPDTETAKGFGAKDFGTTIKVLPRSPEGPALLIYQSWTTAWAREALRVLLPGASMLVMGGTRTYHRMACGVEDAGFEIKDTILWCYNSGFPKAQDLGELIDERNERNWRPEVKDYLNAKRKEKGLSFNQINEMLGTATSGGGTASTLMGDKRFNELPTQDIYSKLKVILDLDNRFDELIEREEAEREKISEDSRSYNHSLFDFGKKWDITAPATPLAREWDGWKVGGLKPSYEPVVWAVKPPERSCTENVLKHGVGAINVDACRIPRSSDDRFEYGVNGDEPSIPGKTCYGDWGRHTYEPDSGGRYPANMVRTNRFGDGHDRFYFVPKAERAERWFKCQICDVYQNGTHFRVHITHALHCHDCGIDFPNTKEEREAHKGHKTESNIIAHPTVKPVALGEFLIKLVTREGQVILDQFCGLGSFLVSARNLNRHYIGFDKGCEYIEMAKRRLAAIPPPLEAFA